MLIVEGPDGAGKTQLIQRLRLNLQLELMPRVVSSDTEMMVDLQEWVNEDLHAGLKRAIYDRHRLISEPIYGPVLRKEMQPVDGVDVLLYHPVRVILEHILTDNLERG